MTVTTRTNATRLRTSTSAGVLRPEDFARLIRLERYPCSPALTDYVENYWSLHWELPDGVTHVSSTLPHPACTLSVERGAQRSEVGDDPVVVTGVVTKRFDVDVRDSGWVFAAKFRPGGLAALIGGTARDWRDRTLPARELRVDVTQAQLATRLASWTAPPSRYTSGVMGKYVRLVSSAADGAVTAAAALTTREMTTS